MRTAAAPSLHTGPTFAWDPSRPAPAPARLSNVPERKLPARDPTNDSYNGRRRYEQLHQYRLDDVAIDRHHEYADDQHLIDDDQAIPGTR